MKLALLGDVHGNVDALAAVLSAARTEGVTRVLNTGDLVGYYHRPAEVLAQLSAWTCDTVRGNHDDMLSDAALNPERLAWVTARYGHGVARAMDSCGAEDLDWIASLPRQLALTLDGMRILLCHGAPWDTDCYVYPDAPEAQLERIVDAAGDADLVVMGHTHYQALWRREALCLVNPGSVGQPRDRKPGAAWALLDTATGQIDLRREDYDTGPVIAEAQRRDPDLSYLWTVLTRR